MEFEKSSLGPVARDMQDLLVWQESRQSIGDIELFNYLRVDGEVPAEICGDCELAQPESGNSNVNREGVAEAFPGALDRLPICSFLKTQREIRLVRPLWLTSGPLAIEVGTHIVYNEVTT